MIEILWAIFVTGAIIYLGAWIKDTTEKQVEVNQAARNVFHEIDARLDNLNRRVEDLERNQ